eukprot:3765148-Rhodomonas_salina.1
MCIRDRCGTAQRPGRGAHEQQQTHSTAQHSTERAQELFLCLDLMCEINSLYDQPLTSGCRSSPSGCGRGPSRHRRRR